MTLTLGIETSCDETAVAVVRDGVSVESNVIASQTDLHARYGGVVPEQASRAHLRAIRPTLEEALERAHADWDDLDAIAVTHGPGLAGALLVGVATLAAGLLYLLILLVVGQPLSDPVVLAGGAAAGAIYNGLLAIATYPIARSMRHVTEKQASFGL